MPYPVFAPEARPCVWMCAGLISYKLCERGFDCERCPLDAALRGTMANVASPSPHLDRRRDVQHFPEDRLYSEGHLWVQATARDDVRLWRVGLDAFASAVMGCLTHVHGIPPGSGVQRGDPVSQVDLGIGTLALGAPVGGRVVRSNEALRAHPERAITEPYGDGWLVEIQGLDASGILGLRSASQARAHTDADLTRFRRSLALRLLTEPAGEVPGADPASPPLSDLRQVLGGSRYLELVGQFVH